MAKVIKAFKGQLDGEPYPRDWRPGDEIPDGTDLARVAVAEGWAKKKPAPANKMKAAPSNKSASSRPARRPRKKTPKRSKKSARKS